MKSRTIEATWFEYDGFGDADVLVRRSEALPPPTGDDVSIEVMTASINHMEVFLRNGKEPAWSDGPWPRRSGSDFAGIVVARGPLAEGFPIGAEVIGHVRTGAHASHLNVSSAALVRKPRNVTWETAGSLYLAGATALDVLDELHIGPDDTIVVSAAAGGVGSVEVQLAKRLGARVIGTCGARNFDYLRQLGIIPVRYGDDMVERIRHVSRGPVTAYIDNFGKDGQEAAEELGVPQDRYRSSADRRDTELRLLSDEPGAVAHGTELLGRLARYAHDGAFRLLISGLYPLDDIAEAFEDLAKLHSRGKIVLATHPVTTYRGLRARDVQEAMK